ncbi:MAG: N-acyl homoserine lactonase family protein [Deltaproteobacteria bacterium]|nr:N-acyl homoserine lactonase family protein [Nannocystaceae bacterium]
MTDKKRSWTSLLAFAVFTLAGCARLGPHAVSVLDTEQAPADWRAVLDQPVALEVTGYLTGEVRTGPKVLIDRKNPRTPAKDLEEQWVPALAYLVSHPTQGRFLLDTGVAPAGDDGSCDFGIEPFFHVPCRARRGDDVASQLTRDGVGPRALRFVLMSHLHGDHAGGIAALARRGHLELAMHPAEWKAAARELRMFDGYIAGQLDDPYAVRTLPVERAVQMPLLGSSLDLFGDGSVWVVEMPGHTRGEISVLLNAASGALLLTFDAAHLAANIEHRVRPGFAVDNRAATDAVTRIADFAAAYPEVRIIYGHEPTQWASGQRRVVLAGPA